jgi:hypothetical protein
MDEDDFWKIVQIVNDNSGGDMDRKCAAPRQQITALSKDAALEFARLFDAKMDIAYCWPLWGAEAVAGKRPPRRLHVPDQPSGVEWQEDEVYALFPKLNAKFG